MEKSYTEINSKAIDKWAEAGWEWSLPISRETFGAAKNGQWDVVLTPLKPVPKEWFRPFLENGKLSGAKILGLASGGGQQMPVFAALGADCAVLDNSEKQLASERGVAEREGYEIAILKADMTKPLPFEDGCFDLIFHPVSNCYIEDVRHVWKECFRILKPGGALLAGMNIGIFYLFDDADPLRVVHKLPWNPLKNPERYRKSIESDGSLQFSHTLEEQIGGQLQAGFILTALYEDYDNSPGIGDYYPPYIATRSIKP